MCAPSDDIKMIAVSALLVSAGGQLNLKIGMKPLAAAGNVD
jgi:hypothetical protein